MCQSPHSSLKKDIELTGQLPRPLRLRHGLWPIRPQRLIGQHLEGADRGRPGRSESWRTPAPTCQLVMTEQSIAYALAGGVAGKSMGDSQGDLLADQQVAQELSGGERVRLRLALRRHRLSNDLLHLPVTKNQVEELQDRQHGLGCPLELSDILVPN